MKNHLLRALTFPLITGCFALNICETALAQVPQGIPYQAIARNASGVAIANTAVKVRFSIRDSIATGAIKYQETHNPTTSALGLFSVNVGMGTVVSGTFSGINWGKNAKFLQVELDPSGGANYTDLGTTQMMSVPYALYSSKSQAISETSFSSNGTYSSFFSGGVFTSGSGVDGDFVSVRDTSMAGVKQFKNFTLKSSHVLNIGSQGFLILRVSDTCRIAGKINGKGKNLQNLGTGGGSGGGNASYYTTCPRVGFTSENSIVIISGGEFASEGKTPTLSERLVFLETGSTLKGAKGCNGCTTGSQVCNGISYPGTGGNGGGGLIIYCKNLIFTGEIDCSGSNGIKGIGAAGGGGGGGVLISAKSYLTDSGIINVDGGNRADYSIGGFFTCGEHADTFAGKGGNGWVMKLIAN